MISSWTPLFERLSTLELTFNPEAEPVPEPEPEPFAEATLGMGYGS